MGMFRKKTMEYSKVDMVVSISQRLERILEDGLGAKGKGLHQKITSVESMLPTDLIRNLRWIATMRNKTLHENRDTIKNRHDFQKTAAEAEIDLLNLVERHQAGKEKSGVGKTWVVVIGLTLLISFILLIFFNYD